ncbi:MAG: pilus assembly protein [Desulfobulbaceae bacterium]|nr:pilus assembly protein [Desulfobulbaceae bacterium]
MKPLFHSEQGASAVEFALVLPILVFLTFAIIEFGILLFDKAVITNASREGARNAIVFNANADGSPNYLTESDIKKIVIDYTKGNSADKGILINLGNPSKTVLNIDDVTISCSPNPSAESWPSGACTNKGYYLNVQVNYTYNFLVLPNLARLLQGDFNDVNLTLPLHSKTVMRMEG